MGISPRVAAVRAASTLSLLAFPDWIAGRWLDSPLLPSYLICTPPHDRQTARVVVTNTGAIPTRFTIQDISPAVPGSPPSSPPLLPSAKLQQTPEPTPAQQIPNDGNDNSIAAAFNGDLQPEELPEDHRKEGKDGDPSSGVALRDALPKTEGQLLARAAAIRNAALRHKEGRAEIEVHAGEGGSGGEGGMAGQAGGKVGAYESSEIVVTFAPLNVGEFRVVKVHVVCC